MRRFTMLVTCLLAATVALATSPAWAQSPHFVGTPKASLVDTDGVDLGVFFKEAGLGSTPIDVKFTINATAVGSCACVTKSGNCPAAANKFPPTGVAGAGTFSSGKNGTISQLVIAEEPLCQQVAPATCPHGQTNTVVSVSYSGISITATDANTGVTLNGPTATSPTSLAATGFTCP